MARFVRFCIFGFLGGIALRFIFDIGNSFTFFVILVSLIIFLPTYFSKERSVKKILFSATLLFFALGYFRAGFIPSRSNSFLEQFVGRKVVVEGVITKEPDIRENSTFLVVSVDKTEMLGVKKDYFF